MTFACKSSEYNPPNIRHPRNVFEMSVSPGLIFGILCYEIPDSTKNIPFL